MFIPDIIRQQDLPTKNPFKTHRINSSPLTSTQVYTQADYYLRLLLAFKTH